MAHVQHGYMDEIQKKLGADREPIMGYDGEQRRGWCVGELECLRVYKEHLPHVYVYHACMYLEMRHIVAMCVQCSHVVSAVYRCHMQNALPSFSHVVVVSGKQQHSTAQHITA